MGGTPAEAPPSSSPPAPHLRALGARGCVCYGIKRRWDAAGEDQPGYGGWGGLWVGGIWGGCGENEDPRRDRASPLRSPMEPVIPSISRSLPVPPPHPNFRPCPHLSPSKLVRSALCVPAPLPSPSAPLTPGTSPGDKRLQPDPGFIESPLFSRLIPPCPPFLATGRGGPGGLGGRLLLNC